MKWSDLLVLLIVLGMFAVDYWRRRRARRLRRGEDVPSDGDPLAGGPWSPV